MSLANGPSDFPHVSVLTSLLFPRFVSFDSAIVQFPPKLSFSPPRRTLFFSYGGILFRTHQISACCDMRGSNDSVPKSCVLFSLCCVLFLTSPPSPPYTSNQECVVVFHFSMRFTDTFSPCIHRLHLSRAPLSPPESFPLVAFVARSPPF